jgi:hypothetical protein
LDLSIELIKQAHLFLPPFVMRRAGTVCDCGFVEVWFIRTSRLRCRGIAVSTAWQNFLLQAWTSYRGKCGPNRFTQLKRLFFGEEECNGQSRSQRAAQGRVAAAGRLVLPRHLLMVVLRATVELKNTKAMMTLPT